MREKLNSNPLAQVAVVGVLLLVVGVFVLSSMGGGGDSSKSTTTSATVTTPAGTASVTATVTPSSTATAPSGTASLSSTLPTAAAAPPIPGPVTAAWSADETVVLLFVRNGGIDDRKVAAAVDRLSSLPRVAVFVVPARRIARYAAIAQGVQINRVPALVVMRPKRFGKGIPTASVHYGFQSTQSVVQAVIDAGYKGRTVTYYP
jgi:hypothetical protein